MKKPDKQKTFLIGFWWLLISFSECLTCDVIFKLNHHKMNLRQFNHSANQIKMVLYVRTHHGTLRLDNCWWPKTRNDRDNENPGTSLVHVPLYMQHWMEMTLIFVLDVVFVEYQKYLKTGHNLENIIKWKKWLSNFVSNETIFKIFK